MSEPLLVSLHLPKTAGTSFRLALEAHYGDRLVQDYAMLPMQLGRGRREWRAVCTAAAARRPLAPGVHAVHGHFLPIKYRLALLGRRARYITWLRDPVERVLSHYHFWRRDYDGADPAQPMRNRVLREDWSLERFCLGPELRNLYGQYLCGFGLRNFAFIGITEHYADDLAWFSRHVMGDAPAAVSHARTNPARQEAGYGVAPGLRDRIERHHAADVALYRRALILRSGRMTTSAWRPLCCASRAAPDAPASVP